MEGLGALATNLARVSSPWIAAAVVLLGIIKALTPWGQMKKDRLESEAVRLTDRVASLEQQLKELRAESNSERIRLEEKIEQQRETYEGKLDIERSRHESEMRIMRHAKNNSDQCMDMLILVLEAAEELPEKVRKAIVAVKAMRDRQREAEATEKATFMHAKVVAAGQSPTPPPAAAPATS